MLSLITKTFFAVLLFVQVAVGITWDGGGATNNWSEPANWSGDVVPVASDDVVFDGTSTKDCLVNVNISLNTINLNAGYTGTVSMGSGFTANITNSSSLNSGTFTANDGSVSFGGLFTLGGGNFNAGSGILTFLLFTQNSGNFNGTSGDVNVNSTFTINGGSFTTPSGLLSLAGNLTIGGAGTFNHNNGTLSAIGIFNVTYTVPSGTIFNNFTINKVNDTGISLNSTIRVIGTLTLTDGLLHTGTVKAENSVTISPTFGAQTGSQGGGFGTLLIQDGSGLRTLTFPVGARFPNVQLNDANATINTSGIGSIITQDFKLDAGSVELGSNTLSFGNLQGGGGPAFAQNGGSISVQTGGFTNNVGNLGATVLNAGIFDGGSGTVSFEGGVFLNGGIFNTSSGDTFFKRFLTVLSSATFNHNGGTVTLAFNGLPTVSLTLPAGGTNFNNLIFNVGVLLTGGNAIVNGDFTQMSGESTVGQIEVKGNMLMQNAALGGSTNILFTGTGAQTYTNNSSNNFSGIWTINKTSGVLTLASNLILGTTQAFNITSGEFSQGGAFDLTAGSVIVGAGGFWRNNGTGDITLGGNVTNAGEIDIDGTTVSCNEADSVLIRSSVNGIQRNWTGAGSFFVQDADVRDQAGSAVITSFAGLDSGNNGANWTFNSACSPFVWDGGGATNNWTEALNWRRNLLPQSSTVVVFDGTSVKNAVVDTDITVEGIQINSGYTGVISWSNNANNLTVGNSGFTQNGGSVQSGRLTVNGDLTISNSIFQVIFASSLDINGNLSVTNSNFAFAPNAITTLSGNFALISPIVFNSGGGLHLDSNTSATLNLPTNTEFNGLTINKSSNAVVDISPASNLIVNQQLNLMDGFLNGFGVELRGSISVGSGFDGGNGSIIIQNTIGIQNGTISDGAVLPDFVTLNSSTYTLSLANSNGTVNFQNFTLQNGTVDAASALGSTVIFDGVFTQIGGTFQYGQANQNLVFNGNFSLSGGHFRPLLATVDMNADVNLTGGMFTSTSGTLSIGSNFTRSPNNTFNHNSGTVVFDESVNSNIILPDAPNTTVFNNVRFDTPNSKTIDSSVSTFNAFTVNGLLEFNNGFIGSSPSSSIIEARGDVTIGSGLDNGFATTIKFGGSGVQTFTYSGGLESFNWTVDKSGGTVNLASDLDISDTGTTQELNLVNGTFTTGNNKVIVGAEDNVSRTNGFVIGNLQRNFNTNSTKDFDIGTANGYSPVNVNATSVNGNSSLTISATQTNRAGMDASESVQRFWTLTETGDLTVDLTFNYLETDVNGTEANYKLFKWNGSSSLLIAGSLNTITNTLTAIGISDFSDWAIGNLMPTAAAVEISGRVLMSGGRGIPNAILLLNGGSLTQPIYARTNPFGYYRFKDIQVGDYVISVSAKGQTFNPPNIFISADQNIENMDFLALPREANLIINSPFKFEIFKE